MPPSIRAQITTRRTYNRPLDAEGKAFETWEQTVDRVIDHQAWLWDRALNAPQTPDRFYRMHDELRELRQLMLERKVSVSGRTLWLGGTDIAKKREASQFNCAHLKVETIHDVVDSLWLLLQGCGVGFTPAVGTLSGLSVPIRDIQVIRSTRTSKGGRQNNKETYNKNTRTWTLSVGDSAEAWAKSIGKLLAYKGEATTIVLDFSQIRPAGERLAGYGWISSGDTSISRAYLAILDVLNKRAGRLLRKEDILDIMNWLGTILSSRRSAEIMLFYYDTPEWEALARAKTNLKELEHRSQSNNSLVFWKKPTKAELENVFNIIQESGGSEPGIINGDQARERAPWFAGVNPCAEILLGNKSFCNLTEVNVGGFMSDEWGLDRAVYLTARANYRQTLVNLDDGILQRTWHENNEYLRLCGVGLTGIATRPDLSQYDYRRLRNIAIHGAYGMADELGTQKPKNITTIKPSGTLSKIMDTTEGCHKPMGKYIFNRINFSRHDPIVAQLREANYDITQNPTDTESVLIKFPVEWSTVEFTKVGDTYINTETALDQLATYKLLMDSYVEQNCSITVSYKPHEVPDIVDWLLNNWDHYVGVSFLPIADNPEDNGYAYMPQEVVTEEEFQEYKKSLLPVTLEEAAGHFELEDDECVTGVCPVK